MKRQRKVSTVKKVKLNNTFVRNVLLNNLITWGLSMIDEKLLDSFHMQQLRKIIGVQYQLKMKNEKVYEVTKARHLITDITAPRWKLWGQVLM